MQTSSGVRVLLVGGEPEDPRTTVRLDAPGTYVDAVAELLLRVGTSDERLCDAGTTWLLLRLADAAAARSGAQSQVQVGLIVSSVSVAGTRAEVAEHLQLLTAALHDVPEEGLEAVRGRLLAEEATRGLPREPVAAAVHRFGARGPGSSAYGLLAVPGVSRAELQAWADRFAVTGGVVLHGEGLLPEDLVLALRPGPAAPEPDVVPVLPGRVWVPEVDGEALSGDAPALLSLSVLVPRAWASHVALWSLARRAERALVDVASSVEPALVPLGSTTAQAAVRVTSLPGRHQEATDLLVAAFEDLVGKGPGAEELADDLRALVRRTGPLSDVEVRRQVARELLHGRPSQEAGEPRTGLEEASWTDVGRVLRGLPDTALLQGPSRPADARWSLLTEDEREALGEPDGEVFVPLGNRASGTRLVVGPRGVGTGRLAAGTDQWLPWDDVEVVLEGRSTVQLVQRGGRGLVLTPVHWVDAAGRRATGAVQRHAPPGLVRPLAAFREAPEP
ncbi:MAG: hypothetical protein JWN17_3062, partial [Frankiales bacterium]|nr:hypothetical protein [Frankiales bacterium]